MKPSLPSLLYRAALALLEAGVVALDMTYALAAALTEGAAQVEAYLMTLADPLNTHTQRDLAAARLAALRTPADDATLDQTRYNDLEIALHRYNADPMVAWTWWKVYNWEEAWTWEAFMEKVLQSAAYAEKEGVPFGELMTYTHQE